MILEILGYVPQAYCHRCKDEQGFVHLVDIVIDSNISIENEKDLLELVGKKVECSSLSVYSEVANSVNLIS